MHLMQWLAQSHEHRLYLQSHYAQTLRLEMMLGDTHNPLLHELCFFYIQKMDNPHTPHPNMVNVCHMDIKKRHDVEELSGENKKPMH